MDEVNAKLDKFLQTKTLQYDLQAGYGMLYGAVTAFRDMWDESVYTPIFFDMLHVGGRARLLTVPLYQTSIDAGKWENQLDAWTKEFLGDVHDGVRDAMIAKQIVYADPEQNNYFWAALLGNIVWAAMVFFPPGELVLLAAAVKGGKALASISGSMIGAIVGSGAVAQYMSEEGVGQYVASKGEDLRRSILTRSAEMFGSLTTYIVENHPYYPLAHEFAMLFGEDPRDIAFMESSKPRALFWRWMCPSISYKRRGSEVLDSMLKSITSTMSDYNRQYSEWRRTRALMISCIAARTGGLDYSTDGGASDYKLACVKEHGGEWEFRPKLLFVIPVKQ